MANYDRISANFAQHATLIDIVHAYNVKHGRPTHIVIDDNPAKLYNGYSATLVRLEPDAAWIRIANGDERKVPRWHVFIDIARLDS